MAEILPYPTGLANPIPPAVDIDAEQALLGAIFINNGVLAAVSGVVKADHFSEPLHQQIFSLCSEAFAAGKGVSPVTLYRHLPPKVDGLDLTMSEYLARLATAATTIVNAIDFAETVRDMWGLRQVHGIAQQAIEAASVATSDPRMLISDQVAQLDAARAEIDERRRTRRAAGEFVSETIGKIDHIRMGGAPNMGAPTGLLDLDQDLGGLHGGNLVVIAGRPGMGKSVLAASLARQCAAAGSGVGLFSLEMHDEQISARILADHIYDYRDPVSFKTLMEGKNIGDETFQRIVNVEAAIRLLPLEVDTSPTLTVSDIGARTRSMASTLKKRGYPLRAIFIDYLKYVRASDRYRGQRVYEVGEITAGLKALAKDMGICVVLLAQLNRQVETRADKRPELSDLRESGDIEADADTVLLLFREAYYLAAAAATDGEAAAKLLACENELEIIIAKNRSGPVRPVKVFCDVKASAVRNLARA
jgi:replicative DNA helicase